MCLNDIVKIPGDSVNGMYDDLRGITRSHPVGVSYPLVGYMFMQ